MTITSKKIATKVQLPNGHEIDIELIPELASLSNRQKDFLALYLGQSLQKTYCMLTLSIPKAEMEKWMLEDAFSSAMDTIKTLYAESMRATHFVDSFNNSKIRTKTLEALEAGGFESKNKLTAKNQQNIFLNGSGSLVDIIESIKQLPS